jgi:hypothetical protein
LLNKFTISFHLIKLAFIRFCIKKRCLCNLTLLFVKTIGPEVYKREILIMLVSKVTNAIGVWVFCGLTRHARLFVPTNLAANLNMRKRSVAMTVSKKEGFIPLPAPECDPTPCGCWGQMSLEIEERIAKLLLYSHVPLP